MKMKWSCQFLKVIIDSSQFLKVIIDSSQELGIKKNYLLPLFCNLLRHNRVHSKIFIIFCIYIAH